MEERERRLLTALAYMADQYLIDLGDDTLDSLHMTAGEHALEVLAEYGFVTLEGLPRWARWTEAGQKFLLRGEIDPSNSG